MTTRLATVTPTAPIFHINCLQTLQLPAKLEPQTTHFRKCQNTSHCIVIHTAEQGDPWHRYVYHFTNNKQNGSTKITVIYDLLGLYPDCEKYCFKIGNCSTQYKCDFNVYQYHLSAFAIKKVFFVYNGVRGHGKDLVDAICGLRLKVQYKT